MKKRGEGVSIPVYTATPQPTVNTNPRAPQPFVRKATLLSFVFVMYSYTTGGPFGLEE
ncbi:MAG: hypothetical protein JWO71_4629 [Candidatus Acidoferrum typicum]|nr:hypothetical protein [Candidatus Acidoferrum typicum]